MEELWHGEEKVKDLGDHEEQHGFTEVAEDGHHGERHTREVAEGVAHEHPRRVPTGRRADCFTLFELSFCYFSN